MKLLCHMIVTLDNETGGNPFSVKRYVYVYVT